MTAWCLVVAAPLWLAAPRATGPPKPAPDVLRRPGETTVFSFVTAGGKAVSLCQGPRGKYLVYRFGTAAKTELQYPAVLDASSWRKFTYWAYHRGGGVANAGMEFYQVSFKNKEVEYELLDQSSAYLTKRKEESYHREVSLTVLLKGKPSSITVKQSSVSGSLYLDDAQRQRVTLNDSP